MPNLPLDLVLKNATVLIPNAEGHGLHEAQLDLGVRDGRIAEIAVGIKTASAKIMDLKGLHILPGVIDSQVHFREPGLVHKEDLESGTRAAVMGGVTTIFEMPNTSPSTTTRESLEDKLNRAKNRCHAHYAFFIGASPENADQIKTLELLPHCSGTKIFMGSSTGSLLVDEESVLERILRSGVRRVIVHSEDEARLRERRAIAEDSHDVHNHPVWRDVETAMISTQKLIRLARKTGRPVHVLHVSSAEEMDFLKDQKDVATVEALPQHLTLYAPDCYDRLKNFAQQNPPIREKRHMDRIWQAVLDGTVDVIGSDHAPHTREEKERPYPQSPSGMPGVQTLIPVMLNHVNAGRLSLAHFTQLVTENPRRVFGVQNKGRIEIGYDADFTVVDMKKTRTITNDWIVSKCGWTPYDGMKVTGWPTHTILLGRTVMENDQLILPSTGLGVNFAATSTH
ncbi:MAG: dihydroorotase [Bdellovibrionaceae bacterium]|nr:dihydroorotase [Pseudobdellovibrionaceae bacterium]